ncbi:hypothetical protein [Actinomadura madurae]|uniref:hypothetical protein n=1 Tax=Actinomadura madurae TaxID=1993 RepID=UPI0020D2307A|nr:hypothetical protein [Actinomadura madurae]MCQ0017781.1 hypothetical protein [Actinomadura madurae]
MLELLHDADGRRQDDQSADEDDEQDDQGHRCHHGTSSRVLAGHRERAPGTPAGF